MDKLMPELITKLDVNTHAAVTDAVEWSLANGLAFRRDADSAFHVPFHFAASGIETQRFEVLKQAVPLLGKLIHGVAEDSDFIHDAIAPVAADDAFFAALLDLHEQTRNAPRLPLLIMRSDFMDDAINGPLLIECNSIAAGMGPFGQRTGELHQYVANHHTEAYRQWSDQTVLRRVNNPAIERLSEGIATAARLIRDEFNEPGPPIFLMVVQEHEDNVFDQNLLAYALQEKGVRTLKKTFGELACEIKTGADQRLIIPGIGGIDCVYLRAGYAYADYVHNDLNTPHCCQQLLSTRALIEQHRIAINATVSQQLATSKRVQMLMSMMPADEFARFGLTQTEASLVKSLMTAMRPVDQTTIQWFEHQDASAWVLKNQGEGGGHCIFDQDIAAKLRQLAPEEYPTWALMQRLRPLPRSKPALVIRRAETQIVDDLISEIGMFTVHINGQSPLPEAGYAGYLVRSKSASTSEGGVHSGQGVLDSLSYSDV